MITPDVVDLPHEMDGNTKVFRLVAEPVKRRVVPWKTLEVWGYNGSCPGPTIQVTQGDRVRVIFENRLPESTSMHWHGLELPIEQDGVPWISQKPTAPGETFTYEFTVHQEGTFFYHAHSAMQEMMGLIGIFVAHPKEEFAAACGPRLRHRVAGVGGAPSNSVPNSAFDGIQLANVQRSGGAVDDAVDRTIGQPGAIALRKSWNGSPSHSLARKSVRHHRDGRRPRARNDVVSDEYGAGWRGASASRGI